MSMSNKRKNLYNKIRKFGFKTASENNYKYKFSEFYKDDVNIIVFVYNKRETNKNDYLDIYYNTDSKSKYKVLHIQYDILDLIYQIMAAMREEFWYEF